jgi:hypothetical protein
MKHAILLCGLIAILADAAIAQTHRGVIRGRVTDSSGNVVEGAQVTTTHEGTNAQRVVTTGREGTFALPELPPGPYRIVVEAGSHKMHIELLTLEVNQDRRVDIRLQLGALTERVEVVAPRIGLRRDSPSLGTVVENRQILSMPLDGRNVLELTLLAPGASTAAQGSAGSVRGDFAFSVNGGREDANSFLLDGADNVDPKLNTVGVRPPVDAIQEFEVLTSTPDASFGRHAAAQVNVILKSGSNSLQGTAYEFFRHRALDARNFFAPRDEDAPEYRRHQYGVSIGGPVVRDRTFFFGDYEGTRRDEGITRIATVPAAADASIVPPFARSPVGAAIAALYPAPNRPGQVGNFVSSPAERDRTDHVDARIDHNLGSAIDLTARYSVSDRRLFEPFSGPGFSALPGFGSDVARRGQNAVVSATQLLSPRFVNETRVGFNRVSSGVTPEAGPANRQVGLPEPWTNPRDAGLSFITVTGYSPLGAEYNNPQHGATNTLHAADTATWTRGPHLVKFGADVRLVRQDAFRDVQARGGIAFTGLLTGRPLAELLLGLPTFSTLAQVDNPQRLRTESYAGFATDSWQVRSDVTVTAGLRYELTSPPVDADDRATLYNPQTGVVREVGTGGLPRAGYASDRNNWAPRLGVSWSPGSGAMVVRGAYGVYYNHSALAPSEGLYFNAPYFDLSTFFQAQGLPPLTLFDPFPRTFPIVLPDSATAFQSDLRTPYMHQYNVNVQRQLGPSRAIEVAYVGSRGRNLIAGRDLNQPPASPSPLNLRPNPFFGDVLVIESRAQSTYNALQMLFQQRYDRGLTVLAAYTLAKSEDDASAFFASAGDPNFPQDSNNVGAEWGRSNFDVRHRLSVSAAYDIAGWQASGILTLQSGRPFTVALLPEIDNSNTGRSALGFGANDRPDVSGDPSISDPDETRWFNTGAFSMPPFGSFGSAGRSILDGPGYANLNVAVIRDVRLGARARVQLRVEAFNVFNRVNLDNPDNFFGSPTFGQVLSAGSPRRMQLGARLMF